MQIKGMKFSDTIEFRLGVITIALGIIFLVGTFWFEKYEFHEGVSKYYLELSQRYARVVESELVRSLDELTANRINTLLNTITMSEPDLQGVLWRTFDKNLTVVHASSTLPGERYNLMEGVTAFRKGKTVFLKRDWLDQSLYIVITPLYSKAGDKVGAIELRHKVNPLIPYLEMIIKRNRIYEAVIISLLFASIGYLMYKYFILNPLVRFKSGIDKMRLKQSTDLIPISRQDEIGMIMVSFNNLLNELRINIDELESTKHQTQAYSEELKSAYERLETQIAEMKEAKDQITELYMVIEKVNIDLDKKVIELSILNEVGRAISSILDLDQLLNMIVKWATEEMGARQGAILLHNMADEMEVRAVHNLDPQLIGKVSEKLDYEKILSGEQDGFLPAITVPFRRKGITSGVINIGAKESRRSFTTDDLNLLSTLANQAAIAIENATLYETIQQGYFDTIQALTLAIEAKDLYTRGHSARVTKYALAIAEKANFSSEHLERLRYAGILHDIGKIGIKEAILRKKGKLSEEEYNVMKKHPTIGESIVEPIVFLAPLKQIIRSHHERIDGNGYPDGIKGNAICLEARILAVADAYDAMTTNRPYREQMAMEQAIAELKRNSGTQFDPWLVEVFIEWLAERENQLELTTASG